MEIEAVIGLEVHAELETESKMFCACPVVDPTRAEPNIAVCPICAGMPGVLPVVNRRAVEYGLRVALALGCEIARTSIFARKNYFYPDLPKGYQISQYESPLARNGALPVYSAQGERIIRIRRVHLEEDTGKLTHVRGDGGSYSLVDLNRAGIPLLEIVTEPDLRSCEEVRAYAVALRSLLRYLGVNSGDMEKGVLRIEPNISIRPAGSDILGTRVEIKNLNSLRALERSVAYEIMRQSELLRLGQQVRQETMGWDETREVTFTQRVKEGEDDYRYFPEPDLPPLVIEEKWIDEIRSELPELPAAKLRRFMAQYGLDEYRAGVLVAERAAAEYFERAVAAGPELEPRLVSNWITGELFGLLNQASESIETTRLRPTALAELVGMTAQGEINNTTAKLVLTEMFTSGRTAREIVAEHNLGQISDASLIAGQVTEALALYPEQLAEYLSGKEGIARWLFGKVMRSAKGQANPQVVQRELERQLARRKAAQGSGE
jgi:aspartyl-tRNA(Asn)/glutamyl-tRNA(Gln) amidotransferase subunit B